ncbi:hypothetical protein C3F09_04355 [candidate division GN15 bacterium]|uniref:Cbb3-type cytochrome c oxidase subunit 3 n=1 Tax=candidate division GN15 bacterium TaxID=2072418 RepID=A0A855X922_9BACT|nr:MAG: hypothetical protein C3F09_04355 [candidate division GN15 bacterium]
MISEFITSIAHTTWLPAAMLVIAMLAFAAVIVWVVRLDKEIVRELERLPLDSTVTELTRGDDRHV